MLDLRKFQKKHFGKYADNSENNDDFLICYSTKVKMHRKNPKKVMNYEDIFLTVKVKKAHILSKKFSSCLSKEANFFLKKQLKRFFLFFFFNNKKMINFFFYIPL